MVTIPQGMHLAQLIPLPSSVCDNSSIANIPQGSAGLGSLDAYWVQPVTQDHPTLILTIERKKFQGILDTGADTTVISQSHWPSAWPLVPSLTDLKGIGQSNNPLISSRTLSWKDEEGNQGTVTPFVVLGLSVNLWGRDILSQIQVILYSPNSTVTQQMLRMNYIPGTGLGKAAQGRVQPIQPVPKEDRHGLGYSGF
ncbi:endogenous retrovirus group K member 7 Pro protein-like [Peromyscus maniculatus bairdii]|uniref:endogenous retrovirus group K member 7 Pro protein-like n=1 Tax=Peromyscus maniculatus bairdii TaxID=230844 RepID=UPI003FD2B38A